MNSLEAVKRYYRDNPHMISSPFGGVDGLDEPALSKVLEGLGIALGARSLLDVGCGRGFLGGFAAKRGCAYTGVDIHHAQLSAGTAGFAVANAIELPFAEGQFDLIFCLDSFEHFPDIARAAEEFKRVLTSHGTVFLSVPNYSNVAGLFKLVLEGVGLYEKGTWAPFGKWQPQAAESFITPARIRREFSRAGFQRFHQTGLDKEIWAGMFPLLWHRRFPQDLRLKLESTFPGLLSRLARSFPSISLHNFWRIDRIARS